MNTVVVRDDVYREHPWMTCSIYKAFCEPRNLAVDELYETDALRLSLPWLINHIEETWRVLGKDFWAYGLERNRPALEAIGQYVYQQVSHPALLDPTSCSHRTRSKAAPGSHTSLPMYRRDVSEDGDNRIHRS